MDQTTLIIGVFVGVVALALISEIAFEKFRIPEQIILMLIGVILAHASIVSGATIDSIVSIAPTLGTFVLGLIILDAGLGMKAYDMLIRSPRVLGLAALEPIVGATVLAFLMHFVLGWPLIYGAIFGSLLGSLTPDVMVPLLRNMHIEEGQQNSMILDSVYDVVTSIIVFEALFGIATSSSVNLGGAISELALAFLVGMAIGLLGGFAWVLGALKRVKEHQYLTTLGAAFAVFLVSQLLGGNGFLSILIFGLIIGNYNESYRRVLGGIVYGAMLGRVSEELKKVLRISNHKTVESLRAAQKEITFITKAFFFVYLGLIFKATAYTVALGIVISFVLLGVEFFNVNIIRLQGDKRLYTLIEPRGISPIILSEIVYAYASSASGTPYLLNTIAQPLVSMTFVVIFTTIIIAVISGVILTDERVTHLKPATGMGEQLGQT